MNDLLLSWLSLFPGASRDRPRFMALAEAVLRQATDLITLTNHLQSGFSFAYAEGVQLDQAAESVELRRMDYGPGVTDEDYRRYVLAKLALWTWDGTNENVPAVLAAALPGSIQTDNGDGTVTVTAERPIPSGTALPVPAGIRAVHSGIT